MLGSDFLSKGLVFAERPYNGEVTPTTYEDMSRYRNDGTITGATWFQLPSGLWVLSYDGTGDYVSIPDSDLWALGTGDFTIEFWAYVDAASRKFLSQGDDNDDDMFYIDNISNHFTFRARISASDTIQFTVDDTTPNDVWTHFALVRDGVGAANWRIYYDLVSKAKTLDTGAYNGSIGDYTEPLLIGARKTGGAFYEFAKGYMALFRICNYACTPAQIRARYHAGKWYLGL